MIGAHRQPHHVQAPAAQQPGPDHRLDRLPIPALIITEAILGYLGLGLRPATDPSASSSPVGARCCWTVRSAINAQPWLLLAPAICVALVVLAFNYLGDGLRDALDPRLAGSEVAVDSRQPPEASPVAASASRDHVAQVSGRFDTGLSRYAKRPKRVT